MTQVPELLTASEVAKHFRVDPGTVRRWAAKNQIKHQRIPSGGLRFPVAVIQEPSPDSQPEPASAAVS